MLHRWHYNNRPNILMDRVTVAGFGGTLATVSGSFHEIVGILAGCMTILYMAVKIFQEVKKKK